MNAGMLLRRPVVWLTPVLAILAVLYLETATFEVDYYAFGYWATAMNSLFLVVPAIGAMSAWEIARIRRGGFLDYPTYRSRLVVIADAVWPVFVAGVVSYLSAGFAHAGLTVPPWQLVVSVVPLCLASVSLGAALGSRLRAVVAAPLMMVGTYVWLAVPLALEPLWLQHLSGIWTTFCCNTSKTVSSGALAAALPADAGFFLAGLVVLLLRGTWKIWLSVAACLVLGFTIGSVQARTLGPDPTEIRQVALVCRATISAEVCVYPEHLDVLDQTLRVATRAVEGWERAGIQIPDRYTEKPDVPATVHFRVVSGLPDYRIRDNLAYSVLPGWPSCEGAYEASEMGDYAYLWLVRVAGGPTRSSVSFDEDTRAVVYEVLQRPLPEQGVWYKKVAAAMQSCDPPPPVESM